MTLDSPLRRLMVFAVFFIGSKSRVAKTTSRVIKNSSTFSFSDPEKVPLWET